MNGRRFGGRRTHTTDPASTEYEKTPSEASDNPLCSTTAVCWPPIVEMCRIMSKNVIELSKAVEICRKAAQTVGEMAKGEESERAGGNGSPKPVNASHNGAEKACDEGRSDSRHLAGDPSCHCRWAKPGEHPAVARRRRRYRSDRPEPGVLPHSHPAEGTG